MGYVANPFRAFKARFCEGEGAASPRRGSGREILITWRPDEDRQPL
jgi:hypothetical protein